MAKTDVRNKILAAGAELVHRQGFNNTGLADVLAAARVPKGSFYFYFKNKEDFGLALIEHHGAAFRKLAGGVCIDPSRPALARLRRFFGAMADLMAERAFVGGCPIGNLVQEMSDLSPALRQRLAQAAAWLEGVVAHLIEEARMTGEAPDDLEPVETARFLLASWQGAVMAAKLEKTRAPLDRFFRFTFDRFLAASPATGKAAP